MPPSPQNFRRSSRRLRGFSLLELLFAIALLAALMVLLFAVSGRVRQAAQTTRCANQLRQVGVAMMGFAGDNQQTLYLAIEKFGAGTTVQWARYLAGLTDGQHNRGKSGPVYLADLNAAVCPIWSPMVYKATTSDTIGYTYGAASRDSDDPYSTPLPEGKTSTRVIRLATLDAPSSYWLLTDSLQASGQRQIYHIGSATAEDRGVHFRHGDRANALFADGHVRSMTLRDFSQLRYYARQTGFNEKGESISLP